jgi:hypothetical protein
MLDTAFDGSVLPVSLSAMGTGALLLLWFEAAAFKLQTPVAWLGGVVSGSVLSERGGGEESRHCTYNLQSIAMNTLKILHSN